MRLSLLSLAAAYAFVAPHARHAHAPRRALNTDEATPPPPSKAKLRRMSRSLYVRGERRLGSGRYEEAADLFRECVALTPKDSYAWRALATALGLEHGRASAPTPSTREKGLTSAAKGVVPTAHSRVAMPDSASDSPCQLHSIGSPDGTHEASAAVPAALAPPGRMVPPRLD